MKKGSKEVDVKKERGEGKYRRRRELKRKWLNKKKQKWIYKIGKQIRTFPATKRAQNCLYISIL